MDKGIMMYLASFMLFDILYIITSEDNISLKAVTTLLFIGICFLAMGMEKCKEEGVPMFKVGETFPSKDGWETEFIQG